MKLVKKHDSDWTVIQVEASRIDAAVSITFKDLMRQEVADEDGPVFVDLTAVSFIDSSGLGAIVAVRKMLGEARDMALGGLSPDVEKVFRLTRMDRVFAIHKGSPKSVEIERL